MEKPHLTEVQQDTSFGNIGAEGRRVVPANEIHPESGIIDGLQPVSVPGKYAEITDLVHVDSKGRGHMTITKLGGKGHSRFTSNGEMEQIAASQDLIRSVLTDGVAMSTNR